MIDWQSRLPLQVKVLVRGWLNCNQVVLRGKEGKVLIDSGYHSHAARTLDLLRGVLGDAPLQRLVNTHCHSDHIGGNAAVARRYGCPISVPVGEAPYLEPWDGRAFWMGYADQYVEPFAFSDTLAPGDTLFAGDLEWQVLAAPGHDDGALIFYCPEHGILISGDALWEHGLGVIMPREAPNPALDAAENTLETIAALDVRLVIPGHGAPFADAHAAIRRAQSRLAAMRADVRRTARTFLKSMYTFALLAKGGMPLADYPGYIARVPCYGDICSRFLGMGVEAFAEQMLRELIQGGAVEIRDGFIHPTMQP